MTLAELKAFFNTNIRQKTAAGSITPTIHAAEMDRLADFVQEKSTEQQQITYPYRNFALDIDQLRFQYRAVFDTKVAFVDMDLEGDVTTVTYQLIRGATTYPVRTTMADINADIAANVATATEVYSVILIFGGATGWNVGGAVVKSNLV